MQPSSFTLAFIVDVEVLHSETNNAGSYSVAVGKPLNLTMGLRNDTVEVRVTYRGHVLEPRREHAWQ